jgi:hypothetical protein
MLMLGLLSDLYLVQFVSRASLIFKPVVNLKIWQQKYKEVRQAVITQIRFDSTLDSILPLIQSRERNKQLH